MGEDARRPSGRGVDRLTVQDAARSLGVSEGAIRKRVKRGTLRHDKGEDGRVYVYLDAGVDKGIDEVSHPDTNALISRLEDEVRFLREELARKDAILLNMTENIRQLTASEAPEPRERPETASEGEGGGAAREEAQGATERPWWRRMFGG